jgi:hypothetical protein
MIEPNARPPIACYHPSVIRYDPDRKREPRALRAIHCLEQARDRARPGGGGCCVVHR